MVYYVGAWCWTWYSCVVLVYLIYRHSDGSRLFRLQHFCRNQLKIVKLKQKRISLKHGRYDYDNLWIFKRFNFSYFSTKHSYLSYFSTECVWQMCVEQMRLWSQNKISEKFLTSRKCGGRTGTPKSLTATETTSKSENKKWNKLLKFFSWIGIFVKVLTTSVKTSRHTTSNLNASTTLLIM